jgi:hypothetical protein
MPPSGKRRSRPSSLHDVGARSLLVLLFACVSAGAALLGTPLLALIGGFVAVALSIELIFPVTGFLRIDSQHAFQRLLWQHRRRSSPEADPGAATIAASSYSPVSSNKAHAAVTWASSRSRSTRSSEPPSHKELSHSTTRFDPRPGRAVAGS